jgi:hypothetical protein
MKAPFPVPASLRGKRTAAFTLPEMLFASTAFLMLVAAIMGANLFGMRIYQLSQTKLITTDALRKPLAQITDEIRSCRTTWVGSVSNGVFLAHVAGELQTGSGLLIYPTTNTDNFILYFVNPSDQSFRRTLSPPGSTTVLAKAITNTVVFQAQDFQGNVLTNSQNNCVIHLCLECFRPQPNLPAADYYKLEASATRRALQ